MMAARIEITATSAGTLFGIDATDATSTDGVGVDSESAVAVGVLDTTEAEGARLRARAT
jgi:hypothetical protein